LVYQREGRHAPDSHSPHKRTANILISKAKYERRKKALAKQGGFKLPGSQTPRREIQRGMVDELSHGMVLKPAVKYQRISTMVAILA
jgi:dihydroxy-acid dehydratase